MTTKRDREKWRKNAMREKALEKKLGEEQYLRVPASFMLSCLDHIEYLEERYRVKLASEASARYMKD